MTNGDCKGMYALIVNDKIIRTMIVDILNRLFGSSIDALPNSSVAVAEKKKYSKREEKYDSDIEALKQKYRVELKSGLCIESPLKEIIDICPRTRRRVDAYFGLVSHTLSLCSVPLFTQCFFSFISIFHYKKNCGVDCLIFLHSLFSLQHGIKK